MSDTAPRGPPIFVIRLWQEEFQGEQTEWRGEVRNLHSGEVRYFREWTALVDLLPRMLNEQANPDDADVIRPSGADESQA